MIEVNFSFGSVFFPTLIPLSSVNAFKERGRAVLRNVGVSSSDLTLHVTGNFGMEHISSDTHRSCFCSVHIPSIFIALKNT